MQQGMFMFDPLEDFHKLASQNRVGQGQWGCKSGVTNKLMHFTDDAQVNYHVKQFNVSMFKIQDLKKLIIWGL